MLSITGMTLEQFADLMGGLGYKAEKGERVKVKAVDQVIEAEAAPAQTTEDAPADLSGVAAEIPDEGEAPSAEIAEPAPAEDEAAQFADTETPEGVAADAGLPETEMEVFYTFTWGGNRGGNRNAGRGPRREGGERPQGKKGGKPQGKKGGKPRRDGGKGDNQPKTFSARPPRKEKPIDPDNPFAAALMGLKDKK